MKAAIYSRKSKFTGKGDSIENQVQMCKDHANNLGIHEFEVYEDEGFSGGNIDRPQFQKMLKDAHEKKFDTLICYRLDRVSRNIADFSTLIEELQKLSINFISIREQFDTSTPMGRAMMYIASVFAQLERETIAERVRDNMIELAKSGRWLGGQPPLGFKSEKITYIDSEFKERSLVKLVPVHEDLEVVKFLYSKYIELGSVSQVRKYLLQNNIKTKRNKDFSIHTLISALRNPVYVKANDEVIAYLKDNNISTVGNPNGKKAILTYNKQDSRRVAKDKSEWVAAITKHEGIIEANTWLKIQKQIDLNKDSFTSLGKSNVGLLTGLLRCKKCKGPMKITYGSKQKNNDKKRRYYYNCVLKCNSGGVRCSSKNAPGEELDKKVISKLKNLTLDSGLLFKQLKDFRDESLSNNKSETECKALKQKMSANQESIQNLVQQLSMNENSIAAEYILKGIEKLDSENKQLNIRLINLELESDTNSQSSFDLELMMKTAKEFNQIIDTADFKLKKYLISTIVDFVEWNDETREAEIHMFGLKKK